MDLNATMVALIVLFVGIVGGAVLKSITYVNKYFDSKTDNVILEGIIDALSDSATKVVKALNQTIVDDIKAKSEDGKLTDDEIIDIKNNALTILLESLSDDSKSILESVFGNLESYAANVIESAIYDIKKEKK